jgi:hypothetical protein
VPRIDDGSTDSGPGRSLKNAWITLTQREASDLLESLREWSEEVASDSHDPQWHMHLKDIDGNELTIAINAADEAR